MKAGILLDENGDITSLNGSLVIDDVTQQNQELLLIVNKGELKEYPTSCVGAQNYLESHNVNGFLREVRTEFGKDGMKVRGLKYDGANLLIDSSYEG